MVRRLIEAATGLDGERPFAISSPRSDGTVVIKFRSTDSISAVELAERVAKTLTRWGNDFTQVDDVHLVFPLGAYPK
jgi:hypothetical protein